VNPRKPDYPIARGVSPPPRPFKRQAVASPPATIVEPRPIFPPVPRRKKRGSGLMIAVQAVAIMGLAAGSMALGWWAFHGRAEPPKPQLARAEKAQPPKQAAEPVKPVEQPPAPPVEPPEQAPIEPLPPKAVVKKPMVKPIDKPTPTSPVPEKPPAKPTTSLTFTKDIQPILRAKCVNCHGDRNKLKGGLDVRTLRSLEKGGETGPGINRGEPELSVVWEAIANGSMPPGKSNKLTVLEKKKIHDWLVGGGT
jgi:hypothetical protein